VRRTDRGGGLESVPIPLSSPQVPHGLAWDRTRNYAVRYQGLRPEPWHKLITEWFDMKLNPEVTTVSEVGSVSVTE
jgi:hypothetical protein